VDAVVDLDGQSYLMHNAQEKLRQSEERFQGMFAASVTGIAISTPEGRYLKANDAYCRMLGYTEEELKGLDFASLTHPEDLAINVGMRNELLAGKRENFVMEKRYLKKDGGVIWARVSVSATHGTRGELDTLIVMAEDITERVQAETALRENEQKYRLKTAFFEAQVDSSLDGILIVDNESRKLLQNQRMIDLWDIPPAIAEAVDDQPQVAWVAAQVKDSQKFVEKVNYLLKHPDEVSRDELELLNGKTFERYSAPVKSPEGKYYGRIWTFRDISERKRTEARFHRLVESNVQSVLFWNKDGKITGANDAFLNLVRYTRKELEDGELDWMALTPPEYEHRDRQALEEIAATGSCAPYEKEYVLRDGTRVPIFLGSAAFKDDPNQGVAFVLDLTERKQADREIRLSEQRYRTLIEATASIVWDTPASGEFTTEQPGWTAFTGQSFEELRGKGWLDAIHPEDQTETYQVWSKAVANRTVYQVEHRLRARDKSYHDMMVRAVPILDEQGNIRQWIGIHTDITERKKAEQRILEQAALLDKTRDAIIVRGLDGPVVFWNKGAEKMYGWTRQEAMGRRTRDFLYVNNEKFNEANDTLRKEGAWNGELEHLTATGAKITVEARWTLISNHQDDSKSVLMIHTDITEQKKIEQQFLRAQRMESIGTLAGGIAHDLNNILAPILMSIQMLKVTATDPEAAKVLETIETSARRGADIVRQVLSFARGLDSEKLEVQPRHLLKELENIIKETFPKDIRLEFSVPDEIWTILGDPTQIHQILLNLCVNARDAMPDGGLISISVKNCVLDEQYSSMNLHSKAGRYVEIRITDTGIGMEPALIEKIFEPFFTTKDLCKGTGLGLSTVMGIVKSHNGLINVYSEPGKGSTFRVCLPAMDLPLETPHPNETSLLPRGHNETILVVDDEAPIRTITSQTLRTFGYNVLTAVDGAEAVATYAIKKDIISVVLTDMTMPVMDGAATVRALQRINPEVKIIASSGLNINGRLVKVSELGVKYSLVKPFTAEALLNLLEKILAPERAPAVVPSTLGLFKLKVPPSNENNSAN
jgi:PAS domain S-box-containing protein